MTAKLALPRFGGQVADEFSPLVSTTLALRGPPELNPLVQRLAVLLWLLWALTCSAHVPSRTDYGYDAVGQLKAATPRDASGNVISSQRTGYGYDGAGNLSTRTNDLAVRSFTTDKLNQLTNLGFATLLTVSGVTTTNATNVTVNGLVATLNADGTYTATVPTGNGTNTLTAIGWERYGRQATSLVSVASLALQYDANGNLLFDGKKGLAYDDENQLTALVATNEWKTEWTYDGFGRRRIRKEFTWAGSVWLKTNETRYLFDGLLVLQERDSNNAVKVTYTRGLDLSGGMQGAGGIGGLLARTQAGVTNPHAYYHADGNGNITALIDASQTSVANYRYDPFGNVFSASGPLSGVNEIQFSSKPSYRNVTLFEARPYLPGLGRFAQADPIGMAGGFNQHRFVGNDPVNLVDPYGLWSFYRFLHTGDGNAADEVYNAALDGAADWVDYASPKAQTALNIIPNPLTAAVSGFLFYFNGDEPHDPNLEEAGQAGMMAPGGRAKCPPGRMKPNPKAAGAHTVFKRDPATGNVTKYETFQPQSNPQNPNPWESVKRVDTQHSESGPHFNKATGVDVPIPHVHDPATLGGVRSAGPGELPK